MSREYGKGLQAAAFLKEPVQFDKEHLAVLRIDLRNAVVQAVAGAGLEKLEW